MPDPLYNAEDFLSACAQKDLVFVRDKAQRTASECFNLHTQAQILASLAGGLVSEREFMNSIDLKKWSGPPPPPKADAYRFNYGTRKGYISFYRAPTGKWVLKSLKWDRDQATSRPFANLLTILQGKKA